MLKKSAIAAGAVVLLFGLLFGRYAWDYAATNLEWVQKTAKENLVTIDGDLDVARRMIGRLDPEIRNAMHKIAKQEVKVDQLRTQRDGLKEQLAQSLKDIDRLRTDLERGDSTYVYAGKNYEEAEVKADLARRWDHYKTRQKTLEQLDAILEARMRGLNAATEKLAGMRAAKAQLEADVENLEAQLELVRAAQAGSDLTLDDSLLSRTKDLVKDIETRISVDQKLLNADEDYGGQIVLDEPEDRDILNEIARELDKDNDQYIVLEE